MEKKKYVEIDRCSVLYVPLLQIVKIARNGLGSSNLAKKTLVDKRFLI